MFVLLPTCDTHARIAEIGATLLERYWPAHPPLHVLHGPVCPRIGGATLHECDRGADSPWLQSIATFLRRPEDELFVLMLDDYGMCAPARATVIDAGRELMLGAPSIGMFALSWYPARTRTPRRDEPGVVTLAGTPILLQAAIWRRSWFLALADAMSERASAWGFEAMATQIAKKIPAEICGADIPEPAYLGGHLIDGFDKSDWPLPYHNLMHRGQAQWEYENFLREHGMAFPSRGLGDTIANLARVSGAQRLAQVFEKLTGRECGCGRRRDALNRLVPYAEEGTKARREGT